MWQAAEHCKVVWSLDCLFLSLSVFTKEDRKYEQVSPGITGNSNTQWWRTFQTFFKLLLYYRLFKLLLYWSIDKSTFAVQWFELGTKCTIFSALTTGHNPLSVQSVSCNGQWECVSNVVCINFQTKPRYSDIVGGISVCFALWWGLSPFKYTGGGGGTIIQYKILQQCGAVTRGDWVES